VRSRWPRRTEREEEAIQVARRQLGQQLTEAAAHLCCELRGGEGELVRLLGDGIGHFWFPWPMLTLMSWLLKSRLPLPVGVPEVDPLGAVHDDRVDLGLGGPGEEGVLAVQAEDLVGREPIGGVTVIGTSKTISVWGSDYTTHPKGADRVDAVG